MAKGLTELEQELLKALYDAETIYAEYIYSEPDVKSVAFGIALNAIARIRAAIKKAEATDGASRNSAQIGESHE